MTKTFCDRCGQEIRKPFKQYSLVTKAYYTWLITFWKTNEKEDTCILCKNCQESLVKWWNELKEGE